MRLARKSLFLTRSKFLHLGLRPEVSSSRIRNNHSISRIVIGDEFPTIPYFVYTTTNTFTKHLKFKGKFLVSTPHKFYRLTELFTHIIY